MRPEPGLDRVDTRAPGLAHLLSLARQGAEAVDRGVRSLGPEVEAMAACGLLRASLPRAAGGHGWGTEPAGALACHDALLGLAAASLPLARLFEGHVNAVRLIDRLGTGGEREHAFAAIHRGTLLAVWGADGAQPATARRQRCGAWALAGEKAYCSGLGLVGLALVTAQAEDGLRLFLLEPEPRRGRPEDWDVTGMTGSVSGSYDLDGLEVPSAAALGPAGGLAQEPDFHGGLWRVAACMAGAMREVAALAAMRLSASAGPADARQRHRVALALLEAEGAQIWSRAACLSAEAECPERERAIGMAILAREAIEAAAIRQRAHVERLFGAGLHRRDSAPGRALRDLHFYLRQASLDAKLGWAAGLAGEWLMAERRSELRCPRNGGVPTGLVKEGERQ